MQWKMGKCHIEGSYALSSARDGEGGMSRSGRCRRSRRVGGEAVESPGVGVRAEANTWMTPPHVIQVDATELFVQLLEEALREALL